MPKGIPADPKRNHLAVHTEDHPLEYLTFAGEIPAGEYGGGSMGLWDTGTYETHKWSDKEVMVTFHGTRVQGKYVLFRTRGNQWMIHRMDPPADPDRRSPPNDLRPMLATLAAASPTTDGWSFELKWDGIRAIGYVDGGRIRLLSRNGNDVTRRYPELRRLGEALGARDVVLDGEIVAFDESGRPSFELLQRRMHVESDSTIRKLAQEIPVTYVLFDVLWLDGHSTMGLPYSERRDRLRDLALNGASWQTPPNEVGDGARRSRSASASGSKAWWPSGSTVATSPGAARARGSSSRTTSSRSSSSADGSPARRDAPAASARCSSATTTTADCTTRARSAAACPDR